MNRLKFPKIIFGVAIIGVLGCLSINKAEAACNDYQDQKSCIANKKCAWEKAPMPECIAGPNAKAQCYGMTKKNCLANKAKGCSWYVGCRNK